MSNQNDRLKTLQQLRRVGSLIGKYGVYIALVVMFVAMSFASPTFLSVTNLFNILKQNAVIGIIAVGMTFVIVTGGIDLSVGAQLALVSCILGQFITNFGVNPFLACLIALLASTAFGFLNGFFVARFNMFPFVVTLSTQLIIRGLAQVISGGNAIPLTSETFQHIYSSKVGPIPLPIVILFVVTVIVYIMLHWTKFGRYIFAVGGNVHAAIASGVSEFWTKVGAYTISGLLAGIAGIIFTAKTSSAQSNIGIGYETDAVAACVLGGTSFAGGVATIPGVVMGIFIIGFIYNGMNLIGIESYYQSMTKGAVIIGAVLLDMVLNRKKG